MARELRGIVKGGVVVIEGDERLPDGTRVRIVVEEERPDGRLDREAVARLTEIAAKARLRKGEEPRSDLSERVDEYLAGRDFGHRVAEEEK